MGLISDKSKLAALKLPQRVPLHNGKGDKSNILGIIRDLAAI